MQEQQIKLVKLTSGDEVLCEHSICGHSGKHILKNPNYVVPIKVDNPKDIPWDLSFYSPLSVFDDLKNREFEINHEHILHVTDPFKGAVILHHAYYAYETQAANDSKIITPDNVIAMPNNDSKIITGI